MNWMHCPVLKRTFPAAVAVLILAVSSSCSDDVTSSVPTECTVTIEVAGVAATADVVYYDQADNPMVEIVNDPGSAVPYSRQITEVIDYTDVRTRQVSLTTNVGVGETLSLRVYYEEGYDYPPDNNRRIIAQDNYENPGAAPVNAYTLIASFMLPVQ